MTTLAKNLKDPNGNTILPKTRAEWVYRSDNSTVETSISNIQTEINSTKMNLGSLTTRVDNIPAIDDSNIILFCNQHGKSGTTHNLVFLNFPDTGIVHISFIASADFNIGDIFKINSITYTPKTLLMEDYSGNAFKAGALVNLDVDITNKFCFFKLGGSSSGPSENNPPDESAYQLLIIFPSDSSWTVPETNWYQIFSIGSAARGLSGGSGSRGNFNTERNGSGGAGGAGGGGGATTVSRLFLKKDTQISITVNSSISSFGSYLSSTNGSSSTGGIANGGNTININGNDGDRGTTTSTTRGGDGGSGGLTGTCKYVTGTVGTGGKGGSVYSSSGGYHGGPGTDASQWTGNNVIIGGGGGGGGGGNGLSWSQSGVLNDTGGSGGSGGNGSPGCVIIEKAM